MKKVKLGTRIDKAVNAFFEDENLKENSALDFAGNAKMSEITNNEDLIEPRNSYKNFLKQAFLFFPGTFFLFYISLGITLALKDILVFLDRPRFFSKDLFFVCLVTLLSFFMTWIGLGDLKNKKHLIIPASIILSGVVIGVIVNLTENISAISRGIIHDFGYAVWLFPIALILPFLAKGWVDRRAK